MEGVLAITICVKYEAIQRTPSAFQFINNVSGAIRYYEHLTKKTYYPFNVTIHKNNKQILFEDLKVLGLLMK